MEFIADGLLIAGAATATFYCWVLSARLKGLKDLDSGLGAAIAGLSEQVDEMQSALKASQSSAQRSQAKLTDITDRAETAAQHLEELLQDTRRASKRKTDKGSRVETFRSRKSLRAEIAESEQEQANDEAPATQPEEETPALSIQKEVVRKLKTGSGSDERDELVRTLQIILAANE